MSGQIDVTVSRARPAARRWNERRHTRGVVEAHGLLVTEWRPASSSGARLRRWGIL